MNDEFRDTYTGKDVRDMGGYLAGFEAPARTDTTEKVAQSTSSSSGATIHKLTGNAFQLAFRMLNEGNRNVEWHEFKNRLFEMYRLSDEQYSLKKKLRELSLEACEYDFEKFIVRFQTITSRMVGVSEQQLVFEFLESLPKSLRVDLIARNANTGLREAIKAASHLVECHV
jgi:hypothetical protein